jgi:hypothetical protein
VIVGFRSEAGGPASDARQSADGLLLAGEIEAIEPDFVRRVQYLRVRSGDAGWSVSLPLDEGWHTGEVIHILFPEDALYFFDAMTGERLV